jgi:hypothetical protein
MRVGSSVVWVYDSGKLDLETIGTVIQYPAINEDENNLPHYDLAWVDFAGEHELVDLEQLMTIVE